MLLPELLLVGLVVTFANSYDRRVNYWDAFPSGKLLERLNALTDVNQSIVDKLPEIMQVLTATGAQAKTDEYLAEDVSVDADAENEDVDSTESSHGVYSGEAYERNYEDFVKEYFHRDAAGANIEDILEPKEETQALEPTSIKDQRCRRVARKDGKLCEVCLQLKNNEVSETCTYSHENQPEQYAYGSDTQYKRYRTDPQKRREDNQKLNLVAPSSLCVRHKQENRVCYECKDSKDQNMRRCYNVQARKANNNTGKKRAHSRKRKPRSQSEQKQNIYKRTNSYSYIPL